MSLAADGQDWNGLQIEKFGLNISSCFRTSSKNYTDTGCLPLILEQFGPNIAKFSTLYPRVLGLKKKTEDSWLEIGNLLEPETFRWSTVTWALGTRLHNDRSSFISFPEFSALLVPLIFSRKRGRYYHGDRRSWQPKSNSSLEESPEEPYL